MRVYELAKDWNKTSEEILLLLEELGFPVKGYLSRLNDEQITALTAILKKDFPESAPVPEKTPPEKSKPEPIKAETAHPPKETAKEAAKEAAKEEKISRIEKQPEKPL